MISQMRRVHSSGGGRGSASTTTTGTMHAKDYRFSLGDSFKLWWEELSNYDDADRLAQDRFLKYVVPYYRPQELVEDKFKELRAFSVKTMLEKDGGEDGQWYMNEVRVEKRANANHREDVSGNTRHLVMLHGYGASSGWFYKNFTGIAEKCRQETNLTIHALDMIGFGLSGRPSVSYKHDADTKPNLDIETEGIKWGKYATCIKCGGHLDGKVSKKLHWCNCADEEASIREGTSSESAKIIVQKRDIVEYLDNHKELIREVEDVYVESLEKWRIANGIEKFDLLAHSLGGYLGMTYLLKHPERVGNVIMVSPGGVERTPFAITNPAYEMIHAKRDVEGVYEMAVSNDVREYGFLGRYGIIDPTFRDVWNMRMSMMTMLRWMGPLGGKALFDRNLSKLTRSGEITDAREVELFMKYNYSCLIRASFAETSITRLFDASVVGKWPLLDKLRDDNGSAMADRRVLWLYGEHDFMYKACGEAGAASISSSSSNASAEFAVVSNAGHNLYLDASGAFNDAVVGFLDV